MIKTASRMTRVFSRIRKTASHAAWCKDGVFVMMVSTRGRYALRVIIDMAEHMSAGYIPMKEIAGRQDISKKYLEQIMPVLVKNGLCEGVHGARADITEKSPCGLYRRRNTEAYRGRLARLPAFRRK